MARKMIAVVRGRSVKDFNKKLKGLGISLEKTRGTPVPPKIWKKKKPYRYIRVIHEGDDYIKVLVDGSRAFEITGPARSIIKTLLKRING